MAHFKSVTKKMLDNRSILDIKQRRIAQGIVLNCVSECIRKQNSEKYHVDIENTIYKNGERIKQLLGEPVGKIFWNTIAKEIREQFLGGEYARVP